MLISNAQLTFIRYASELIIIVSNFAVWRGVYLEQKKFSEETQHRGWRMLVRGLALETAFGAFLFAADTTLSDRQQAALEPREIRPPMGQVLAGLTKLKGPLVRVTSYVFDAESERLAQEIIADLQHLNIGVKDDTLSENPGKPLGYGVFVTGSNFPLATALLDWAKQNDLKPSPTAMPVGIPFGLNSAGYSGRGPDPDATISIGAKPEPNP